MEEPFNQITFAIEGVIAIALELAIRFGRDDRLDRTDLEAYDEPVGVIALVAENRLLKVFSDVYLLCSLLRAAPTCCTTPAASFILASSSGVLLTPGGVDCCSSIF
jgi:hypothetical protein